ncbi:MAG: hypothetical protein RCG15_03940 [Candidatus Rickettsia vulgarisii]
MIATLPYSAVVAGVVLAGKVAKDVISPPKSNMTQMTNFQSLPPQPNQQPQQLQQRQPQQQQNQQQQPFKILEKIRLFNNQRLIRQLQGLIIEKIIINNKGVRMSF